MPRFSRWCSVLLLGIFFLSLLSVLPAAVRGQGAAVNSVQFSPDGTQLVTAGSDRTLRIWDVASGRLVDTLPGHDDYVVFVAWSPTGDRLASAGYDGTVRIWDVATGIERHVLRGHTGTLFYVTFSPDGRHVASAATEGEMILWDATDGRLVRRVEAHEEVTASVQFAPDGQSLLTAGRGTLLRLWDSSTGALQFEWSPPGRTFTTGVFGNSGGRVAGGGSEGTIHVYDRSSREKVGQFTTSIFVNSLTFALGDTRVAGAYGDGLLRIWDVATGELLHTRRADPSILFFVAASPDGRTLATVGQDTRIRLWEVSTGRRLRVIE